MSITLGASMFGYNLESMDYCWREAIINMKEFADKIVIVDAGSTDGTAELMKEYEDDKTHVVCLPNKIWQMTKYLKKIQLSYFSNIAHSLLDTDWFFSCQADEIVHENSYDAIRSAIETNHAEAFLVKRINLWKDCFHQLNVPQEKKPCSSEVIRLAKRGYVSFDDAENLCAQCVPDFVNDITIVHYGFVRKKEIEPKKIRHMLTEVFQMGMDIKADVDEFNPYAYFNDEDLLPFNNHPKLMQEWIRTRP